MFLVAGMVLMRKPVSMIDGKLFDKLVSDCVSMPMMNDIHL